MYVGPELYWFQGRLQVDKESASWCGYVLSYIGYKVDFSNVDFTSS